MQINYKFLLLVYILLVIFVIFLLFIFINFYILKWLKKNVDENLYFNNYCLKSRNTLDEYGDYFIKRIYFVKQPVCNGNLMLANFLTFGKYEQHIKKYKKMINDNNFSLNHVSMIIELDIPNNQIKHVLIEKNNSINITDNFKLCKNQNIKVIKVPKNKYTMNFILKETKERIGNKQFFNWHIHRNNYLTFAKEFFVTINKQNKLKDFFSKEENNFFKTTTLSEFNICTINSIINIYSLFQKIFHII